MVRRSIVVPCYNEADNLPSLIERFQVFDTPDADWELILVDNGSADQTPEVLERELAEDGRAFVRVVTVPKPNVGYGHGIMTGLRAARGSQLAWTHADGQTPPSDVFCAFELLSASADPETTFVKGQRRNRPLKDTLFTLGMQLAATTILTTNLGDINGQPKAFHRTLFDLADDAPDDLSLDLYFFFLARKNGYTIRTFDVHFLDREHGESKWAFNWRSKFKNISRSVRYMSELRRR